MADLTGDGRGQLFLIGALLLAATFVVLALFLNSAIYTGNFATRGQATIDSGEVATYTNDLERGAGTLMDDLNADTSLNRSRLDDYLRDNASNIADGTQTLTADNGVVVSIEDPSNTEMGTRIEQDTETDFTDPSGSGSEWTVVEDSRVRQFVLNVTAVGSDDGVILTLEDDNGNGNTTEVTIADQGAGTDLRVEVVGEGTCDAPTPAEVDVFGGTVGDDPCPALETLDTDEQPFTVTLEDEAAQGTISGDFAGTYNLTVDEDIGAFRGGSQPTEYNTDASGEQPWALEAVYDTELEFIYRTESITYDGTIRVAPGEPRE